MDTTIQVDEQPLSLEELANLNDCRAAQYALLARLFRVEVDQALLDELAGMHFPAHTGNEVTDEGYRLIAGYLGAPHADVLTELAVDYVRAFIGTRTDAYGAAYPYENVYTSEKRLKMQAARDEVLAIYRANGIAKQESWHEGEGHVALELEFMQVLATRTAESLRAGDEERAVGLLRTQYGFLEEHLRSWTSMMTADMRKFARTAFYRGLASLTDGMLASDAAVLEELVGQQA